MKRNQLSLFENKSNKHPNDHMVAIDRPQERKSPIAYVLEQQKLRTRQDLLSLRVAVDAAENTSNYNRELLHNVYRDVIKDPNLFSQWSSRKMKTKERPFRVVNANGEEVKELTEVLESNWFSEFIDAVLDSLLWGFTLIEFGELVNGQFLPFQVKGKIYSGIHVVDRDNVKPELGIITSTPSAMSGISFDDPKYTDHMMFVGSYHSHGLLMNAAKYILFKDNALGNWSEWAEVFGMDKRVGYTEAQGEDRKKFIKAIRDMGSNAYGVFTTRDKLEYLGTRRSDAFAVYRELLNYIDEQIAKVIFGQDVVTNNTGRVVGTVGENMANMYGDSDARFLKNIINKQLFPLMENLGFNWKGYTFDWDNTEKVKLMDRIKLDKDISDMGFMHSTEYIDNTYGVSVTEKSESQIIKQQNDLRDMYG